LSGDHLETVLSGNPCPNPYLFHLERVEGNEVVVSIDHPLVFHKVYLWRRTVEMETGICFLDNRDESQELPSDMDMVLAQVAPDI